MEKRVAIIGAGFGGMATAVLLAQAGFRVTILEKNQSVGGRARVWRKDGFVFDMGPSWYLMPEVFERFFENLGKKRSDYYQLQHLDYYYRVFFGNGKMVDITKDRAANMAVFDSFEKNGAEKLERYLDAARYKYDVAMKDFLYKEYRSIFDFFNKRVLTEGLKLNVFQALDRYVSRFFSSTEARQLLEYAMVFLGTSPYNAPALYSIMSHVDLNLGVFFPKGGMASLVEAMERLCDEYGVKILRDSPVRAIVCNNGIAEKIVYDGGELETDIVVSNADYRHTEIELLDRRHRSLSEGFWNRRVLAPTMFIIYLGISKKLPNVRHHNLYFSPHWDSHFQAIFKDKKWADDPCYYVSVASYDDPEVAPVGQENVFFLVPSAPGLRDDDGFRERYAERILEHFENLIGQSIRDAIEIKRIYSHRDFSADYNAFKGTSLGLAHTLFQTAIFRPPMRSRKVKNLRFVGQYTHPGIGVPMTYIAADIVARGIVADFDSKPNAKGKFV